MILVEHRYPVQPRELSAKVGAALHTLTRPRGTTIICLEDQTLVLRHACYDARLARANDPATLIVVLGKLDIGVDKSPIVRSVRDRDGTPKQCVDCSARPYTDGHSQAADGENVAIRPEGDAVVCNHPGWSGEAGELSPRRAPIGRRPYTTWG